MSLNQMTKLFMRDKSLISRNIKSIFEERKLKRDGSTIANFETVSKEELRLKYRKLRSSVDDKLVKDKRICDNFLNSDIYRNSKLILCYYPLKEEINTLKVINKALRDNKLVAIPLCVNDTDMNFYYINSIDDVTKGTYGIMEPIKDKCKLVEDFANSVCIVPGLAYDRKGYRLGYGKGYYDNFLNKYDVVTVGFCYHDFIVENLPRYEHDKRVDYICMETNFFACKDMNVSV